MIILGISAFEHDSAACLLESGQLVAAAQQERFSRIKHDGAFPSDAIEFCLSQAGATIRDVDWVGFAGVKRSDIYKKALHIIKNVPRSLSMRCCTEEKVCVFKVPATAKAQLRMLPGYRAKARLKFQLVPYHICHAYGSFMPSPHDKAAILVADGDLGWMTTLLAGGRGADVQTFKQMFFPMSLGAFYSTMTSYHGFKPIADDQRVMALSLEGSDHYYPEFKRMLRLSADGEFKLDLSFFNHQYGKPHRYTDKLRLAFGESRPPASEITQRHKDIARGFQLRLEDAIVHAARYLHTVTGSKAICLGGSVANNSLACGRILEQTPFEQVFVQPAAGQAGAAIGAAFYIHNNALDNRRNFALKSTSLGPEFNREEIASLLNQSKLQYKEVENPEMQAASLLAKGKTVGWFQGRMEFGDGGLGNRSVLADPRVAESRKTVGAQIEDAEPYPLFAASILAEKASEFFASAKPSPFASSFIRVLRDKVDSIPAVVLPDGTARLHTVDSETNALYHGLITEFEKLTGVPVILIAPLKSKDGPVVRSPQDALRAFYTAGLDNLVIGNFVLSKSP
ncbi:hypothetical protein J7M28_01240 [bacterium]|nr:hypothetical protein [bacterium]